MKKFLLKHSFPQNKELRKTLLIMKQSFLIFFIAFVHASGSIIVNGQNLTFTAENQTIREVFRQIESETNYRFFYNEDFRDLSKLLSLELKDYHINELLDMMLESSNVTYKILDSDLVVITPATDQVSGVQQKEIRGSVKDQGGYPLPGVSVFVQGTTTGTVTNIDGNYVLLVPEDAKLLVFSFVGMQTEEVFIGERNIIDIVMTEELLYMDEVVVVGYGTQRRSEITGSIASVRGEALQKMPTGNIGKSLTGMATGLRVFDVDGDVTRDPVIQIRGESTISLSGKAADTQPLIVIDGSPGGSLRDVAPEDIESIEILKDAAAAAIYGSRGANGVVLIQTRRGHEGQVRINFDSYFKFNLQESKHNLTRPYDHALILAEGEIADNRGLTPRSYHNLEWLKDVDIDYLDDLFNNTWSKRQRISVAGGSANHQFRLSGTFDQELGTTINNEYNQGTFLFASDHKLTERLSWSNTFSYRTVNNSRGFGYEPRRRFLDSTLPYIEAVNRNDPDYFYQSLEWEDSWADYAASREDLNYINSYSFNINPSFKIIEGLELSNRFIYRQNNTNQEFINYKSSAFGFSAQPRNDIRLTYGNGYNYVNDVILNFNRTFADRHSIYATAVWSAEKSFDRYVRAYRSELPLTMVPSIRLGDVATMTNDGWYTEDTRLGLVGRVGYTYDGRYVIAGSVRRDASSRFTPESRWGTFPSVSFAWNIHNESFMQDIDWLSNARIRASWGQLGRDKLDRYQHYSMVTLDAGYPFGNSPSAGAAIRGLAYSGTGWETVETFDVGAEAYFLNNRLKTGYNYWTKTTKDMIFAEELPILAGLRDLSVSVNAGELLNRGHEIELEWRDRRGQFVYNIETNLSTYYSEVVSWPFDEGVEYVRNVLRSVFAIQEGYPLMSFFIYETNGLWQNDAEIDMAKYHRKDDNGNFMYDGTGNPVWGWPGLNRARPQPGSVKFVDRNGDGNINEEDRYHAGQRYPKVIIGLNAGFEYKGFDFYIQTNSHMGQSVYIETHHRNANAFGERRLLVDLTGYEAWMGEGSANLANRPRITNRAQNNFRQDGDHSLYRSDYFRIKAINLGYTFSAQALQSIGLTSIRLYLSGYNVLTFTKYPGFDPEMGSNMDHDNWSHAGFARPYPYGNPRSFSGGIQVNF